MNMYAAVAFMLACFAVGMILGHAAGYMKAEKVGKIRLQKANDLHVRNVREIDKDWNARFTAYKAGISGKPYIFYPLSVSRSNRTNITPLHRKGHGA